MSADLPNRRGFFALVAGLVAGAFAAPAASEPVKKPSSAVFLAELKRRRPAFFGRYNSVAGAMANLGIDQMQQNRARIDEISTLMQQLPGGSDALRSAEEFRLYLETRHQHLLTENAHLLASKLEDAIRPMRDLAR